METGQQLINTAELKSSLNKKFDELSAVLNELKKYVDAGQLLSNDQVRVLNQLMVDIVELRDQMIQHDLRSGKKR